jgi:hypothetical protein
MTSLKTGFALLALLLASSAAPATAAEEVVPPENSAVNQYTEVFPTARGAKDVHKNRNRNRSPGKVLGTRNAQRLEQQGADGRAVAEVATETAPVVEAEAPSEEEPEPAGVARSGNGRSDKSPPARKRPAPDPAPSPAYHAPEVDGSSGIGEVIASATGSSSSGGMGILLPLLVIGTVVWAIAFLLRTRHRRPVG